MILLIIRAMVFALSILGTTVPLKVLANDLSAPTEQQVTAQQFVNLQEGDTPFEGYRRAHAKGVCVTGEFVSNGRLSDFTSTVLFEKTVTPFVGRFSVAGNNPLGADLSAPVRSLALTFTLSAFNQWRIAMNTPPVTAVTNPQDFYAQLVAIKRGPQAIAAFFNEHPESKDFLTWKNSYTPSYSFSDETYHSINAFYLHKNDKKQAVRWWFTPNSSAKVDAETGNNALHITLQKQLEKKPIIFDWQFQFAGESDDPNNPAVQWPANREIVTAGQLVIRSWQDQQEGACNPINFDPNVLPQGISASDDPILKARSAAYAESYKRRAIELLRGKTYLPQGAQ